MRLQRGPQQAVIRHVGEQRLVHQRIVVHAHRRAGPDLLGRLGGVGAEQVALMARTEIDRHRLETARPSRRQFLPARHAGFERFRVGIVGHRLLVRQAGFLGLEGRRHDEYPLAFLQRHDAPGAEAAAVADTFDFVVDRQPVIAGQQEHRMHRMRAAAVDRAHGRIQRLPEHLAAKNVGAAHEVALAAENVGAGLLELQQAEDFFGVVQRGVWHACQMLNGNEPHLMPETPDSSMSDRARRISALAQPGRNRAEYDACDALPARQQAGSCRRT